MKGVAIDYWDRQSARQPGPHKGGYFRFRFPENEQIDEGILLEEQRGFRIVLHGYVGSAA